MNSYRMSWKMTLLMFVLIIVISVAVTAFILWFRETETGLNLALEWALKIGLKQEAGAL